MSLLDLGPGLETVGFESRDPTLLDRAHSGRAHARKVAGQLWSATLRWPRLRESEFRAIFAFLVTLRGRFQTFDVVLPGISYPAGVATGSPAVVGAGQTGRTLAIGGATASTAGWLLPGDVFAVAGSTKVYMITAPAATDATGAAVLQFEPDLVAVPADAAALTVTSVPFRLRLEADRLRTERRRGLYSLEVGTVEDVL